MGDFVHLHLHTEYSLLDGAAKIVDAVNECKRLGQKAMAITDHGNMFGCLQFSKYCLKQGIKPIIGCELYLTQNMYDKKGGDFEHLVLLCKNKKGYKSLIKLDSLAYVDGFYYKPRIDYKTLAEHSEGLICLSACLAGRIPKLLLNGDFEGAKKTATDLKQLFGEDFYIEIQDHGIEEQKRVLPLLVRLARELEIQLVATNDVHYISKSDAEVQDVLLCVQTQKTIDDPSRMKFSTDEFYIKSYDEMAEVFPNFPDALENTNLIADKVTELVFDINAKGEVKKNSALIPGYIPPNNLTPYEYLHLLSEEGLEKRYPVITTEVRERADYELETINKMGFIEYYLIVWDFINYAKSRGIPVGEGRGSGVGSIIAYAVGITNVDPLKYNLLFERFLNVERVSMPDFDVDFCMERRGEVIEYVIDKYGADKVAQIVTFGTMASRAAIKDVGRVFKVPYADVDKLTKLLDGKAKIEQAIGRKPDKEGKDITVPELKKYYEEDPVSKHTIDMAIKLEGMPRNTSKHAAGVVICREVISDNVPLQRKDNDITTQFNMIEVEELGLLKMDFLGLTTLTDIRKAFLYIKEDYGIDLDFDIMGYEDKEVYKLLSDGNTDAVFQLESPGMKKFMRDLKPVNLEDVIAGISLYRPGPMDAIPKYIENKEHPEKIVYKAPQLESILNVTHGCIVYQEQVMQIVQKLGGFSLGGADILRRIMSKKKIDQMEIQKKIFIYGETDEKGNVKIDGALRRGVTEQSAIEIFDEMKDFAKYAFNKSHAAAYATLAYKTAYLKKYYPIEFICAVLNDRISKPDEIIKYLNYLRDNNIEVLPPDINNSKTYFSVQNKGIRFGLIAIKNVGEKAIDLIVAEREKNGKYLSLEDFLLRSEPQTLNKRMLENMIYAGVFDTFNIERSKLIVVYEGLLARINAINKQKTDGQISLFGDIIKDDVYLKADYPDIKEYDAKFKLIKEKEVLGVYVTGNPLQDYINSFKEFNFNTSQIIPEEITDEDGNIEISYTDVPNDMAVTTGGIIASTSKVLTRTGKNMGFINLEDLYGSVECVLYPQVFERYRNIIVDDEIVKVSGKLQVRKGEKPKIILDKLEVWEIEKKQADEIKVEKEEQSDKKLFLRIMGDKAKYQDEIMEILGGYKGKIPVIIKNDDGVFKTSLKVENLSGLKSELLSVLSENDICFVEK